MPSGSGLKDFTRAMFGDWLARMSGPLSVPAAVLALWVTGDVAKIIFVLSAFVCVWVTAYRVWKPEREIVAKLQNDEHKQGLLDEISELRSQMVVLRIEIEEDLGPRKYSSAHWQQKLEALQHTLTAKIEQFASKAEANAYSRRGNIPRPPNPLMGGFLNPVHLDVCIYDLDYLKQFIHDYSRNRERP